MDKVTNGCNKKKTTPKWHFLGEYARLRNVDDRKWGNKILQYPLQNTLIKIPPEAQ